MVKVKGKTVLITGAASGIGFCTAEQFARAGSRVIVTDVNAQALEVSVKRLKETGAEVFSFVVDIADRAQVEEVAREILERFGFLDILINNAGIGYNGEIAETSLEKWKQLMDVNFWGALHHIYAFLPSMTKRGQGHIVNVSSGQIYFRLPTWSVYATTKLALSGFSEMLHYEIRKFGIKVTTVYPFMVNTPFYNEIEGETFFSKLSMKLVPYYSNSPETVARKIFHAVRKEEKVEMVNILNSVGFLTQAIPPLGMVVARVSNLFLGKPKEEVNVVEGRHSA